MLEDNIVHTSDLPPVSCPVCAARLERCTGADRPQPGNVTLCGHCWVYLVFTPDLGVRRLSDGEWLALPFRSRQTFARLRDLLRRRPSHPRR